MIELVQTNPNALEQIATITGIAAALSPVILFVVEAVKQAMGDHKLTGFATILVAIISGLFIGLLVPAIGIASGAISGMFAVAGMTAVRNFGAKAVEKAVEPEPEVPVIEMEVDQNNTQAKTQQY